MERARASLDTIVDDEDDVAMAAVTAAELLVGVELATPEIAAGRASSVEEMLSQIPVEEYDLDVARAHAALLAHGRRRGRPRGAHDLIIAATAVATGRTVVSLDPRGFEDLPGVVVRGPRA